MSQLPVTEKTFSRQVKLLKQLAPFRDAKYCVLRDILAQLYGYSSDHNYRKQTALTKSPQVTQLLLQRQYPELVNRLSKVANIDGQVAKHVINKLWPHYVSGNVKKWRQHSSTFVFYGCLTEFLNKPAAYLTVEYTYDGLPSIKDAIEAQGIPHTEVVLILLKGKATNCDDKIKNKSQYKVYPANFPLENTLLNAPIPSTGIAFALDVHLGKLARYLRMLGFDTYYMKSDKGDQYLSNLARKENRIVLTRDKGLLKRSIIKFGYWVRHRDTLQQLREVIQHYRLDMPKNAFTRCLECNSLLNNVDKQEILHLLPPSIARDYTNFKYCPYCEKVYWKGSHFDRMQKLLDEFRSSD